MPFREEKEKDIRRRLYDLDKNNGMDGANARRMEEAAEQAHVGLAYLAEHGEVRELATGTTLVQISGFSELDMKIRKGLTEAKRYAESSRFGGKPTSFSIASMNNPTNAWRKPKLPPERDTVSCVIGEFDALCKKLDVAELNDSIRAALGAEADGPGNGAIEVSELNGGSGKKPTPNRS